MVSWVKWVIMKVVAIDSLKIDVEDILDKRTLIIGDVGTGKTRLTAELINGLIERGFGEYMTIIDLGPSLGRVGSTLAQYSRNIVRLRYLRPSKIYAPRLTAISRDELNEYIMWNYSESRRLFMEYVKSPTDILVVNDLSIFLHRGTVSEVIRFIKHSDTFIGNAYYGKAIVDKFGLGLDEVEKSRVEELLNYMDNIINLNWRVEGNII